MVIVAPDGQLCHVIDRTQNGLGDWGPALKLKLRSLTTGAVSERKVHPHDKVERADLDTRELQYVYADGDGYVFIDPDTSERVTLPRELVREQMGFLRENSRAAVAFHDGQPLGIELPATVELRVVGIDRALPRRTVAPYKPATLETGLRVQVPPFIDVGEVIAIDTRTGEYLSRGREQP
jgi:elongation factor P